MYQIHFFLVDSGQMYIVTGILFEIKFYANQI